MFKGGFKIPSNGHGNVAGFSNFELSPFVQNDGLGRFYEVFGDQYEEVLEDLNDSLVA